MQAIDSTSTLTDSSCTILQQANICNRPTNMCHFTAENPVDLQQCNLYPRFCVHLILWYMYSLQSGKPTVYLHSVITALSADYMTM